MSDSGDKCQEGKRLHVVSEPPVGDVEKQAEVGFTTGGDQYDKYRTTYTDESVDLIVSEILPLLEASLRESLKYDVLELGAGTGKMTEKLIKKLPEHVKYLATDMSENFLEVLKGKDLNVDVSLASADIIPLEDTSVGSVVCAQSFHWFSDEKYIKSIRRVLVPGGKLFLIWIKGDFDHEVMAHFIEWRKQLFMKLQGSLKYDINSMEWRKDIDVSPLFKLQWHKTLPGIRLQRDIETVLANVTTSSLYKSLPPDEREANLNHVRELIKNLPDIDINNITVQYKIELYVYQAE